MLPLLVSLSFPERYNTLKYQEDQITTNHNNNFPCVGPREGEEERESAGGTEYCYKKHREASSNVPGYSPEVAEGRVEEEEGVSGGEVGDTHGQHEEGGDNVIVSDKEIDESTTTSSSSCEV